MTRLTRALVLATAAVALGGCASVRDPIGQLINDSTTTTEIKTRLATEERLGTLTAIGVTTTDDWVRLTGTVASEAERQRVESIARNVAGANRVINELRVIGGPAASPRAQKE